MISESMNARMPRILLIILLMTATAECSATSVANFWISQHGVPSVGSAPPSMVNGIPQINRLTGSGTGSFYIWARPATGMNLVNWSLDVISDNPNAIALTNSWVAQYNPTLNGVVEGPNSIRRWEHFEQPTAVNPGKIKDINGFSLFGDEGMGIGIGPVNTSHNDPFRHVGVWLLARIDYTVGTTPGQSSEIYLQIGSRGMSHCSIAPCPVSSTSDTEAVFGLTTDPSLNAGPMGPGLSGQRGMRSATEDAIFMVGSSVVPQADFDSNQITDNRDLNIWKASYSETADGDADGDGDTDGRDFLTWQGQFNGAPGTLGDFDSAVDGRDFLDWQSNTSVGNPADRQANYGQSALTAGAMVVPEPSALPSIFALVALLCVLRNKAIRGWGVQVPPGVLITD